MRQTARREPTWILLDQGISAVTNFASIALAARVLDPTGFGQFALAYSLFLFGIALVRRTCSEPAIIVARSTGSTQGGNAGAYRYPIAIGSAWALALVAVSLLWTTTGRPTLMLAACFPALAIQDHARLMLIGDRQPEKAVTLDVLWGGVQLVGLVLLQRLDSVTSTQVMLTWALSAAPAAFVGWRLYRPGPPLLTTEWRRVTGPISRDLVFELGAVQIMELTIPVLLATRYSVDAVGSLRAAQTLVGPVNVLTQGGRLALVSMARYRESVHALAERARLGAVMIGLGACLWVFGLTLIPERWGTLVMGANWPGVSLVVGLLLIAATARGAGAAYESVIRVTGATTRIFRMRLFLTPPLVLTGAVLTLAMSVLGAATAYAITASAISIGLFAIARSVQEATA